MGVEVFISVMCKGDSMAKVSDKEFEEFKNEVMEAFKFIGYDHGRTKNLLFALLEQEKHIERVVCKNCKEELLIPVLEGIEKSDICPACGENVYGHEQTTFENWDAGISEEEE